MIANFAGDSVTALFIRGSEEEATLRALQCAETILAILQSTLPIESPHGQFKISGRIGVGSGEIEWGIVGQKIKNYYFRGPGIHNGITAELKAAENSIQVHPSVANSAIYKKFCPHESRNEDGFCQITEGRSHQASPNPKGADSKDLAAQRFFVPDILMHQENLAELRHTTTIFIGFPYEISWTNIHKLYQKIEKLLLECGGFFNKFEFSDKGGVAMIVFGAPYSYKNNFSNGIEFAIKL